MDAPDCGIQTGIQRVCPSDGLVGKYRVVAVGRNDGHHHQVVGTAVGEFVTLAVVAAYSLACILIGMVGIWVLRRGSGRVSGSMSFDLGTALALGQGFWAVVWMLLGLVGWFDKRLIVAVLLASAAAGALLLVRRAATETDYLRPLREFWKPVHALQRPFIPVAIVLMVLVGAVGIFNAVLPPRFGVGDGFFYYMVLPKIMAASQRIMPVPGYESSHSVLGYQGEMHYAALMGLSGENAALLFVWVTMLGVFALVLRLCDDVGLEPAGKLTAIVALFSSTAFNFFLSDGKVDTFALILGVAEFVWALRVSDWPVLAPRLAGLLTGFAIVAKLAFVLSVAVPAISILIIVALQEKDAGDGTSSSSQLPNRLAAILAQFALFCTLPILTHVYKNAVLFREPFAPLVFLNQPLSISSNYSWNGPDTARHILRTLPYALVYGKHSIGHLSPLFLAALPIVMLVPKSTWRTHRKAVMLALIGTGALLIGACAEASFFTVRFLLPAAVLVLPLLGLLFQTAIEVWSAHLISQLAIAVALCTVMLGHSQVGHDWHRMLRYRFQGAGLCAFDSILWFPNSMCATLVSVNDIASPGDRILHHGYSYWLRPDLIQCMPTRDEWNWISAASSANDEWARIHSLGFRYMVTKRELKPIPDWLSVSLVHKESDVHVYEMKSLDPKRQPEFACLQVKQPAWDVIAANGNT